ncbi:MAG: hypothetical protein ABIM99_06170 [Candidatus Dojkabacteria bacterium]
MNTKNFSSIAKVLILVLFLVGTASATQSPTNQILAKTSADNQNYGPDRPVNVDLATQPDCDGLWVNSSPTQKVYLNAMYLRDWAEKSNPALILDTYNNIRNYLIIGHNVCYLGKCDVARSQFANIMKLNKGDRVSACLGGKLYSGFVFTSEPIPDTRTEVMTDWTGFNTITMFTSYGNCKDSQCSSTNQRWLVAFQRD